jgi:hypothetical protein
MMQWRITKSIIICVGMAWNASAFISSPIAPTRTTVLSMAGTNGQEKDYKVTNSMPSTRKAFLASVISTAALTTMANNAMADDEGFESIAARAARIVSSAAADEEKKQEQQDKIDADPRTAYDFSLPISGEAIPFTEMINQEFQDVEGEKKFRRNAKVKAILVVNIKQDDPLARKNIPELISLASKYVESREKKEIDYTYAFTFSPFCLPCNTLDLDALVNL